MNEKSGNNRITELDAARGIAVLCMVVVHVLAFGKKFGGWDYEWSAFFTFVKQYGGAFFVILSGVCATLSSRLFKRGVIVFCCGMALTGVTYWLCHSGREDETVLIQWGVLHCIGVCMMLWPVLKKLPVWARFALGAVIVVAGYYIRSYVYVRSSWLFPLGLRWWDFAAFDYFPLMPHLGWFMIGSGIGAAVYKDRKPLFPSLKPGALAFIGRNSLFIYLIHLPLLYVIFRTGGKP